MSEQPPQYAGKSIVNDTDESTPFWKVGEPFRLSQTISVGFPRLTPEDVMKCGSEIEKYRSEIWRYCLNGDGLPGVGVDLASGGMPAVPWAFSLELPQSEYDYYNSNHAPRGAIQLRGYADQPLPIEENALDFLVCSHFLEDRPQSAWTKIMYQWRRVLKPGGYMIVLVPELERWNYAIRELGQAPNCSHCAPEPSLGDLSKAAKEIEMEIVEERLTNLSEHDYTILGVFRKK